MIDYNGIAKSHEQLINVGSPEYVIATIRQENKVFYIEVKNNETGKLIKKVYEWDETKDSAANNYEMSNIYTEIAREIYK